MNSISLESHTLRQLTEGPFGSYLVCLDAILEKATGEGCSAVTLKGQVQLLATFGEWLGRKGVETLGDVTTGMVQDFVHSQPPVRARGYSGARFLPRLVSQVRTLGGLSEPPPENLLQSIMASFQRHLVLERGLAESTIQVYASYVRRFLIAQFGADPVERPNFSVLTQADIVGHVILAARRWGSCQTVQLMVTALRAFLNYLLLRGDIHTNFAGSVLKVANWRLQTLPKALEPELVQQLLGGCDRGTPAGKRDYAILLLLARLGLRGGEVVNLSLDSIDWDAGQLILFGKSRRLDRLPLPHDLGDAIAAYLQHGRPVCSTRHVFVRALPPYRGFSSSVAICDIVRRALLRAGLTPARKGAHLLRHGLAKQMMRNGASLTEIGQLLRHQRVDTTAIYAKVDQEALQPLALPWPGGAV